MVSSGLIIATRLLQTLTDTSAQSNHNASNAEFSIFSDLAKEASAYIDNIVKNVFKLNIE